MAVTYGAAGTATGGGSRASISLAAPAAVVANSVVVAVMYVDTSTDQNPTLAGWADTVNGTVLGSGGGSAGLYVLWHRASGAESGPYVFALNTTQYCEGQVHRFDGAITSGDPFEATDAGPSGGVGSNTTPVVDVTTLGADRLLLHAAINWFGGTWTAPASPGTWTKRQQISPDGLSTCATSAFATAGNTGNVTATATGSGQPCAWLGAMVAAADDLPPRRQIVAPGLAATQRACW